MRFCRFNNDRLGVVRGDLVHDVTPVLDKLPAVRWPLPAYDPLIAALPKLRGDMEAMADRVTPVPLASVKLLNPVPNPSKVIGAPVNYHAHIDEANADAADQFRQDHQDHRSLRRVPEIEFLAVGSVRAGGGGGEGAPHRSRGRACRHHRRDLLRRAGRGRAEIYRRLCDRARHDHPRSGGAIACASRSTASRWSDLTSSPPTKFPIRKISISKFWSTARCARSRTPRG